MEKLRFHINGQWSLEKAVPKFDPKKEWGSTADAARREWAHKGRGREKIPRMEGDVRTRAVAKLSGRTQWRRGKDGLEFLLHRGMSSEELRDNHKDDTVRYNEDSKTSWTPNEKLAHRFAHTEMGNKGKVVSAWVPQEHLHSSMRQYGAGDPEMLREEDEWIVSHEKPFDHHSVSEPKHPREFNPNWPFKS